MIVSASYRTDIPAFYGQWFLNRLDAGFVHTVNPWNGQVQRLALDPRSVDGFVFWTRNVGPFFPVLGELGRRGVPFVVHYTITGYPRPLDRATIDVERATEHLRRLAGAFGPAVAVWRYDPVVVTSLTPLAWHEVTFARLCRAAAGVVDEVVLSVMQVYRKTARNMSTAALAHGFTWEEPATEEKRSLLSRLARIAADHGMTPTLCGQPELAVAGLGEARCIDVERLGRVAGRTIAAKAKPHRQRCGCYASKDIGDYDTCPHGCVYCYAVRNRAVALNRHARHDPSASFLIEGRQAGRRPTATPVRRSPP